MPYEGGNIPALLIVNLKRIFTYELITDMIWQKDDHYYSRKAIHNYISKLRKQLRVELNLPNDMESVAKIDYKFKMISAL